jgi:ribosome-binding protein aMBF1 (putative translation factor)
LIGALATAAKQAREDAGVSRADVAARLGKTEDTVRLFERAQTFTALNDLISAYEDVADVSLFDLLDAAKATLKKNG